MHSACFITGAVARFWEIWHDKAIAMWSLRGDASHYNRSPPKFVWGHDMPAQTYVMFRFNELVVVI